jgi:nitrogen fixation/metabolism regulation signal transduction histidine kinase
MVVIITTSTLALSRANISIVLQIDLMVILVLIGLLIIKEFLRSYLEQNGQFEQETKLKMYRMIDIAIVPFLYVFCYVIIYRVLSNII